MKQRRYLTASELASAHLAGWPATREGMSRRFKELRAERPSLFRKRKGRGGGWEISLDALTPAERKPLAGLSFDPAKVMERLASFNPNKRGYSGAYDWFGARELAESGAPGLPDTLPKMAGFLRRLRKAKPAYFRKETPRGPWQVHIRALPAGTRHFLERRSMPADLEWIAGHLPRMFHDRPAAYFHLRYRAILHRAETTEDRRTLYRLLFAEMMLRYAVFIGQSQTWQIHAIADEVVDRLLRRAAVNGLFGAADEPSAFILPDTLRKVVRACAWVGRGAQRRVIKTTIIQFATELPVPARGFCFRALISAYISKVPIPLDALLGLRRLGFITNFPLTRRGFNWPGRPRDALWSCNLHLDLAGPATLRTEGNIPLDIAVSDYSSMDWLASRTLTGRS